MPYYGTLSGGGGEGSGTNDHRLLVGRADANQHPAAAISVSPIPLFGRDALPAQEVLEKLAEHAVARILAVTAIETIPGHRAVTVAANGRAYLASSANTSLRGIAGISGAAAHAGGTIPIVTAGVLAGSWEFTPGVVYLGRSGLLTQKPEMTGGWLYAVGFALSPSLLLVRPDAAPVWMG